MFDYFYGNEHEQYIHIQIPLILIKDPVFKPLSGDSKLLYGLLLNRTSLSIRNNWRDEQNRVYIVYTIEEIMADLNCATQKACKLMKELEKIGLIENVRRGLNKPNLVYVKNYATALKYQRKNIEQPENPVNMRNCENQNSGILKIKNQEFPESKFRDFENQNLSILTLNNIDSSYTDSNHIQSNRFTPNTESYPQSDETDIKTDMIRYDMTLTQTGENEKGQKNKESFKNATADQSNKAFTKPSAVRYSVAEVEEIIKSNIDYDYILMDDPRCQEMLDGILHVIVSTIVTDFKNGYISMGDENVPAEVVRSVFFKLTKEEIEYFIENFNRQTDPTIKLTPYIRTSLFRNHRTNDFYWTNRVHVDMPHMAEKKIHSKRE